MAKYRTLSGAEKALSNFKRKDLKRECIVRGMDFMEASQGSDPALQSFFLKHFDVEPEPKLLTEYDKWLENFLIKERGFSPKKQNWAFHPMLKLGFMGEGEMAYNEGNESEIGKGSRKKVKQGRFKKEKVVRVKRVRDEKSGLLKGTKKSLTFSNCEKKVSLEKTIQIVKKAFPDAKEGSIIIWYRQACKKFGLEAPPTKKRGRKVEDDVQLIITI